MARQGVAVSVVALVLSAWSGVSLLVAATPETPDTDAPVIPADSTALDAALDAADPFPASADLEAGIAFWKRVYTEWGLGQVVLHDDRHHALVYEVLEVPGDAGDRLTEGQRAWVRARRLALEGRLRALAAKADSGQPLDDGEKDLALRVTGVVGADGLAGAADRVRSQRGQRERFRRGLEISGRYHDAFARIFREAGLPEDLAYLPHVESSFQDGARSSAGAVGVWQFTRGAARLFMTVTPAIDERLDPVAAARGAARYLSRAHAELGDWALAVTSYNHGIGGMRAARDRFGADFPRIAREYDGRTFGFASRNFYMEFLAARAIARDPGAFFPEGVTLEEPLRRDPFVIDRPTTPATLAKAFGVPVRQLASLNKGWTARALSGRASLPAGTTVWLPEGTLDRVASRASRSR